MIQNHLRRSCQINLVFHNSFVFVVYFTPCTYHSGSVPSHGTPYTDKWCPRCVREGLHKDNNPPHIFLSSLDSCFYAFDLFLVVNVTSLFHSFIISIKLGSIRLSPYFLEKIGHLLIHVLVPRSVFIHISFCGCNIKYRN